MTRSRENSDARALRSGGSCQRIKNTTTKQKWPDPRGDYNGGNSQTQGLPARIIRNPQLLGSRYQIFGSQFLGDHCQLSTEDTTLKELGLSPVCEAETLEWTQLSTKDGLVWDISPDQIMSHHVWVQSSPWEQAFRRGLVGLTRDAHEWTIGAQCNIPSLDGHSNSRCWTVSNPARCLSNFLLFKRTVIQKTWIFCYSKEPLFKRLGPLVAQPKSRNLGWSGSTQMWRKKRGGNSGATLARVKIWVEPAQPKFLKKETGWAGSKQLELLNNLSSWASSTQFFWKIYRDEPPQPDFGKIIEWRRLKPMFCKKIGCTDSTWVCK